MENLRNMFSLGGGGRANEITQGGHTDGTHTPMQLRRSSFGSEDQWDDTGVPFRDDTSAPSMSVRLRAPGEQTTGEFAANDNVFALEGGGTSNQQHTTGGNIGVGTTDRNPTVAHARRGGSGDTK